MVVADPDGFLLTVCENGYGKRTPFGPNTAGELADELDDDASEVAPEPVEEAVETPEGEEAELPTDRASMRYRKQRRGGKGVRDIKTSSRNGNVIAIAAVRDGDEVMLITSQGMVTRNKIVAIRLVGRNTQGVRMMNLNEGDKLITLAKVASENVGETIAEEAIEGVVPPTPPSPPVTE